MTRHPLVIIALIVTTVLMAAVSAHAQPPTPPDAPRPSHYGWQIVAADVVAVVGGRASENTCVLIGGWLAAGPSVHLAHGNIGQTLLSGALRFTLPVIGGYIGGEGTESWEGMRVGGLVGVVLAAGIDVVFLAVARGRPVGSPRPEPGLRLAPSASATAGGISLGLNGTF